MEKSASAPFLVKESKFPLFFSLAVLLFLVISFLFFPGMQVFLKEAWIVLTSNDELRIKIWVDQFRWFGPALLIIAMTAQMFLLVVPTLALMVVCILAYGPIQGSAIAFVAIYTASSVGYFIGRFLGPMVVEKIMGRRALQKGTDFINKYGFWAVFITRINPFLSNDAVSLASGILKMDYWKFIIASLTGIAPLILFIAFLGESTESLKVGLLMGSVATFVVFVLYIFLKKRKTL